MASTSKKEIDIKRFYEEKVPGPRYCGYSNRFCHVPEVCASCLKKAELIINY